ncbi:spore gernimation protein GerPD [Halobacillus litoralis]|uniref:Spore gernimation protein GerPD n=1 Tax=Halobacillus litoralis TaxID=45668 RepID=A0A845EJ32_9BACI|nr:spore gernimation protein GerPD [Halobacillus litoralis]MYL51198.1 spore gernimation protein GerPD [Halobacillus litoralis]
MNHIVHNYGLHVGNIRVTGVSGSSLFLIGDNKTVRLHSFFDTPPESLIVRTQDEVVEEANANVDRKGSGNEQDD